MFVEETASGERVLTRKGQATRARIVSTASDLMFRGGVASTRIEDVQKAAAVSASQMYHYFDDKQTLLCAVIGHQTDGILAAQEPHLSNLDSIEALRAWRDLLVAIAEQFECKGGCPIGAMVGELAEVHENYRLALAEGFRRWEEAIRKGLQAMQERHDFRPGTDVNTLALALLAAVEGGLLLTQARRESGPLVAALDSTIAYIASFVRPSRRSGD